MRLNFSFTLANKQDNIRCSQNCPLYSFSKNPWRFPGCKKVSFLGKKIHPLHKKEETHPFTTPYDCEIKFSCSETRGGAFCYSFYHFSLSSCCQINVYEILMADEAQNITSLKAIYPLTGDERNKQKRNYKCGIYSNLVVLGQVIY